MRSPSWLRHHWREALLALAWLLPILSLLVFGVMWLREKQALLPWLLGASMLGLAAWPVRRSLRHRLKRRATEFVAREARPKPDWGRREREALELVKEVARTAQPLSFKDAAAAQTLVLQTIRVVAAHYHPKAARPELALTVPEALLLAEHLARDLRKEILDGVPLSRSVTIGTLFRVANAAGKHGPAAKLIYEVADQAWNAILLFVNPPAGAARFAKGQFAGQIGNALLGSAYSKATRLFVFKIGTEAIDLYSGRLAMSPADLISMSETESETARPNRMAPPRLLLAGQVNAGKSSLVNALAGQVLCEVQSVPTPAGPQEHVLSVDGEECAILVDMPGLMNDAVSRLALAEAIGRCDMIVWVTSAVQPGREADVRALAELRAGFEAATHHRPPPWVVALTHVDRLSPAREWLPPYDVVSPSRPKEQTIRAAMEHVAATLDAMPDAVVPVAVGPGVEPWNTEFLWARIACDLDEAKFRQLERLRLKQGSWRDVLQQVRQASGLVVKFVLAKDTTG